MRDITLGSRAYVISAAAVVLAGVAVFLFSPIVAGDTDLWYHLSGGKALVETGRMPDASYFSFIEPGRVWYDYYWLFQAMAYGIHAAAGYGGLVAYRALMFGAIGLAVVGFVFRGREGRFGPYAALVAVGVPMMLVHRLHSIRPHAVSYLSIALFLYMLEYRPRVARWALPALAVLWTNAHGIEYPVMLLICGAYLGDIMVAGLKEGRLIAREDQAHAVSITAAMCAIFLTPLGLDLIGLPFISTRYAQEYIVEFRPIVLSDWTTLYLPFMRGVLDHRQVFLVLAAVSVAALWEYLFSTGRRLSRIVLFAAGAYLLSRGVRFVCEFALLSLPLLSSAFRGKGEGRIARGPWTVGLTAFLLVALPVSYLVNTATLRAAWPLSTRHLPVGVAAFLWHVGTGGNVLTHPNVAGYYQWEMYPKYRIYMNMVVPHMFTDEDMFSAGAAYHDSEGLRRLLASYEVSYVTSPVSHGRFRELIALHPEFVLAFFDSNEYVYVNSRLHPDVARAYGLRYADPYVLTEKRLEGMGPDERAAMREELARMVRIYPEGEIAHRMLGVLALDSKQWEEARAEAQLAIAGAPDLPAGYELLGDALAGEKLYDKALDAYGGAMKRTAGEPPSAMYRKLWVCYAGLGLHEEAFDALGKAIGGVFSPNAKHDDLYILGLHSLALGRGVEAAEIFRFALMKTPPEDLATMVRLPQYYGHIERLLKLGQGGVPDGREEVSREKLSLPSE